MEKRLRRAIFFFTVAVSIFTSGSVYALNYKDYLVVVDEHDRNLAWYYNATGGDRGYLNAPPNMIFTWDNNSTYTVTANANNQWGGGFWYSIIHLDSDNIPLNFGGIFGQYVKSEYQGKVTEVQIVVNSVSSTTNNANLKLRLELKNAGGEIVAANDWLNIISFTYPRTFTYVLSTEKQQNIEDLLWFIANANTGDAISVDSVRLKVRVPDLPVQEEAFLWSYAWLMANYNPSTGMVQDRSNFNINASENVSATGKTAKIVAYSYKKGYATLTDAVTVINNIADALLTKVPRGPAGKNTLWPHFTYGGGLYKTSGSEWSSADTAYAAMDLIVALQIIGDPQAKIPFLESYLQGINWNAILLPSGYISHGYDLSGNLYTYGWDVFGMETIGVNWAYASTPTGTAGLMLAPPNYNGSGFIDNAQYPLVFSGIDWQNNNWYLYRGQAADNQISWYKLPGRNAYLYGSGLFGLSASEAPEGGNYTAYGIGGIIPAQDGNGEVVTLHYCGMISDIRPTQAANMWQALRDRTPTFLQNRIVLSPLNNLESLRVDKTTGKCTVNYLKGSWNIALQAEGWALAGPVIKTALVNAIQDNNFLRRGYNLLNKTYVLHLGIENDIDVFPRETVALPYYQGAASTRMCLRYFDSAYAKTQANIYTAYHQGGAGTEMSANEIATALNVESPSQYNFTALSDSDRDLAIKRFVHWMDYNVPGAPKANVPVLIPTDGGLNWKVVRGFITDIDPLSESDLFSIPNSILFGLWLNDPRVSRLGFNIYQAAQDFLQTYQPVNGRYWSVAEPPHSAGGAQLEENLGKSSLSYAGTSGAVSLLSANTSVKTKTQATADGQFSIPRELKLIPGFAKIFEPCVLTDVLTVNDLDTNSRYLLGLFGRRSWYHGSHRINVVILADAGTRAFKEATWNVEPVRYPAISLSEAVFIARKALIKERVVFSNASLVWSRQFNISRFYPVWKVVFRKKQTNITLYVYQDRSFILNHNKP